MWTPATTTVDANLLDRMSRDSRRGTVGWLGVLTSIGLFVAGVLRDASGETIALVSGTVLAVSLILLNWTRLWMREAKSPFQYTFSVGEFERHSIPEGDGAAEIEDMLGWLSRDLVAGLGSRVRRLSLLEEPPHGRGADRGASHVHISGWYGLRKAAKDDRRDSAQRWQLEIVPQVRIGDAKAPAKLGQVVRFDLGRADGGGDGEAEEPPGLTRELYRNAFERVYWSVASQIYAQIGEAVERKIELLPPGRLRAAAYLHEADDYATSNTLDAYAAARRLYKKARELYDVESREEPATRLRQQLRGARIWMARKRRALRLSLAKAIRGAARREILTARVEIGQARMRAAEWHLKLLCGTEPDPIFDVVPLAKRAIARLKRLPNDVPERQRHLFRGKMTLALTMQLLGDEDSAAKCLDEARRSHPEEARGDAEFFFVSGMNEGSMMRSERLLRKAVEFDRRMERARFHGALRSEEIWRSRRGFEPGIARTVDDEYRAVVGIDPGNIAAWANRGYVAWLLAEGDDRDAWRDKALTSLEAGRQYKEVRGEAIVSELDWNLARLAAEGGDFPKAYEHYVEAIGAQLGDTPFFLFNDYFYENGGNVLVERFDRYRRAVEQEAAKKSAGDPRLVKAVKAFVLNDCGLVLQHHHARSGDEDSLRRAIEAFEDAKRSDDSFVFPAFNLARLHQSLGDVEDDATAEKHLTQAIDLLSEVLRQEPDWAPAQLLMVNVQGSLAALLVRTRQRVEKGEGGDDSPRLEPEFAGAKALGRETAKRVEVDRLGQRLEKCQVELVGLLQKLLPHDCFLRPPGADTGPGMPRNRQSRIDAMGTYVRELIEDETIQWEREFTDYQVAALIEWATALSSEPDAARAAFELCALLRERYYRGELALLYAHRRAALTLQGQAARGVSWERIDSALLDCEALLLDYMRRVLNADPAHHGMLSSDTFEKLGSEEQRGLLLKARGAQPSPLTLLAVGSRLAYMGERAQARGVLEEAAAEGGDQVAPAALLRLGAVCEEMGDRKAAIGAYRGAARFPSPQVAPEAALQAGRLLREDGRKGDALRFYKTIGASDPAVAVALGGMLQASEARDEAVAVYKATMAASPDAPQSATAAVSLARLLGATDPESERALRIAIEATDGETRAEAQVMLAQLLLARPGEEREVERLLRGAVDSGSPLSRGEAAVILARILVDRGDTDEATELYERTIADGSTATASATVELGKILRDEGKEERAIEIYRKAARIQSWTAVTVARILRQEGKIEIAEEICRIGADPDGADPLFAPDAQLLLAELLADREDLVGAEQACREAIASGDMTVAPDAALKLGELFGIKGKPAAEAYASAVPGPDETDAFAFAQALGQLLADSGDRDGLIAVCLTAAQRGPWAALEIGALLEEQGEPVAAESAYRLAAQPGSPFEHEGLFRLAKVVAQRDRAEAVEIYSRLATSKDPDVVAVARDRLGELSGAG